MRFVWTLVAWIAMAPQAHSQIPEEFENLQFFPEDIERPALIEQMRRFSFSLGVRCEHCHEGGPALEDIRFASDAKETKRTARRMLAMVKAINEEHLARLGNGALRVDCFTCHHGAARPEPIEAIVEKTIESSGIDAALARYRELREESYGSAAYDFGVTPLIRLGESLLAAGTAEAAVAVLEVNAEYHPESAWLHQVLGEAHLSAGDREKARASFERSLALNPENPRLKTRLEELSEKR